MVPEVMIANACELRGYRKGKPCGRRACPRGGCRDSPRRPARTHSAAILLAMRGSATAGAAVRAAAASGSISQRGGSGFRRGRALPLLLDVGGPRTLDDGFTASSRTCGHRRLRPSNSNEPGLLVRAWHLILPRSVALPLDQ